MMRHEGFGCGSTGDSIKLGSLHLQETTLHQFLTNRLYYQAAFDKGIAHIGINNQIKITFAITGISVAQAMELFR